MPKESLKLEFIAIPKEANTSKSDEFWFISTTGVTTNMFEDHTKSHHQKGIFMLPRLPEGF